MADNSNTMPPGHVGSLTAEQEKKLQQAWVRIGRICGSVEEGTSDGVDPKASAAADGRGDEHDDKYGQSKQYLKYLAEEPPEKIRETMWSMTKLDNPDALVLRFLRARKWDVDKAIVMLVSTIQWRQQAHIEDGVLANGEGVALNEELSEDDKGFLLQYRSGKSFVRGLDKEGRPVYYVKVRLHDPKAQSDKAMENYILHTIESIRLLVKDPYDMAVLIFDMTGFGLKNMDFAVVKFLIKVFEANYPETLGVICIHGAPWVFQGIWKLIRGWLDPVVASKIHFTRTGDDIEQWVSKDVLLEEYGGNDTWEYEYVEPKSGENDQMANTKARDEIQQEREKIFEEYVKVTADWAWLEDPVSEKGIELNKQRQDVAEKLRVNYWRLDPYIRARNFYDRTGALDENGNVNFPTSVPRVEPGSKEEESPGQNQEAEEAHVNGDKAPVANGEAKHVEA